MCDLIVVICRAIWEIKHMSNENKVVALRMSPYSPLLYSPVSHSNEQRSHIYDIYVHTWRDGIDEL